MKIAVIAPTAIPSRRANSIQVMKMAQALVEAGNEVRLVSPDRTRVVAKAGWSELADHYGLRQEFPITSLPAYPSLRRYDYALRAVRWARSWQAELTYTRLPQAAALSSMIGADTILEIHDLPQGMIGPILLRAFLKGKGARRLVSISHALATDLSKVVRDLPGPPFTVVASDGVDLARYARLPIPREARKTIESQLETAAARVGGKFSVERFTAGYTGHLYAGRGISTILSLADCLPEINFLVVGGEPEKIAELVSTIQERGLQNLFPTGFIPNAELPLFQAACDVLLLPYQRRVAASSGGDISRYLSPMKVFEYLACGRAICASDLPVLLEVLSEQNAILLPPEDITAWVAALNRLRGDDSFRASLAKGALRTAVKYSWEERVRLILDKN